MNFTLRIDLQDFRGTPIYAEYERFAISSPETSYSILLDGYSGNATDALGDPGLRGAHINGMKFTTWDNDNDESPANCAVKYGGRGGWWYNYCFFANLNGKYSLAQWDEGWHSVLWYTWSKKRPLLWTEMKIRPADLSWSSVNSLHWTKDQVRYIPHSIITKLFRYHYYLL